MTPGPGEGGTLDSSTCVTQATTLHTHIHTPCRPVVRHLFSSLRARQKGGEGGSQWRSAGLDACLLVQLDGDWAGQVDGWTDRRHLGRSNQPLHSFRAQAGAGVKSYFVPNERMAGE